MKPKVSTFSQVRGLSLIEVAIASMVLALLLVGSLSAVMYIHRVAQENICASAADASAKGVMEQVLRRVNFSSLPYTSPGSTPSLFSGTDVALDSSVLGNRAIEVHFNRGSAVQLENVYVSICPLPNLATPIEAGAAAPSGVQETVVDLDINNTPAQTADDVQLKLWLWVNDATVASLDATQVRTVHLIYHWRFKDGNKMRWHVGVLRNMRCSAPIF